MPNWKKLFKIFGSITIIFSAIFLSLFQHWEPNTDMWGYWFFARIFGETGKFIIIQRSPPYILYLNLFRFLGFPTSTDIEYIVTTLFTIFAITILFKSYIGTFISLFAVILWLPYMQVAEPPIQKIALALSALGIILHQSKNLNRFKKSSSYAALLLSSLFRPIYIIPFIVFLFFDLFNLLKSKIIYWKILLPQPKKDWPLLLVIFSIIIFQALQSPHPWNTIFFATSRWFPQNSKSEEIIQNYNMSYIQQKYGTFINHDFYFTNQELFGGATDTLHAVLANPYFVGRQVGINFREGIPMLTNMTIFPHLYQHLSISFVLDILLILIFLSGAILAAKNRSMLLFIYGSILMTIISIIFFPQHRYLIFPFIPLYILAAHLYAKFANNLIVKIFHLKNNILISSITIFIFLLLFSPTLTVANYHNRTYLGWINLLKNILNDYKNHDLKVMQNRPNYFVSSTRTSYSTIAPLIKNCKGIMTLDYNFIGAFMDISIDKIYDIWEIPPYGRLGDTVYNGLTQERIDCLLISRELDLYEGYATNQQIRYQNYIKPYREFLLSQGAKEYDLPTYGKAVILQ